MNKRERYDERGLSESVLVCPRPEDELYRISVEEDQNNYIEDAFTKKQQKKLSISAKNYSGAKIVNRKSLANCQSQNQGGYSQWLSLCTTHTKTNIQTPVQKSKSIRKDSIIAELKTISKKFQQNPLKKNEEKFLSMSELCHRYTFINQCTSDREVFESNPDLNPMYCYRTELQHPIIKLELRLQSFEKRKLGQRTKSKKKIQYSKTPKFPPIKREQQKSLKEEPQSDLQHEIVKYLFQERKKGRKEEIKITDELQKEDKRELDNANQRQRIMWRKGKKQGLQIEKGSTFKSKSFIEGEAGKRSKKDGINYRKGRLGQSTKRRVQKQLQECLSLKKR